MRRMIHAIKIHKNYADPVFIGEKTFEVRENDRGYQRGDLIDFTVVDDFGIKVFSHPLNDTRYEITYVLGSFWGLADGWVVFGIREVDGRDYERGAE